MTILVFIKKTSISGRDLLTRPEIGTDAFELFLLTCLTGIFFFRVALTFESSLASFSVSSTRLFFVQVIESLASSHIFSLLQGRSISINSTLSSKSESELPLYSVMQVDCLEVGLIASAIIEFKYAMAGLLLGCC